MYDNKGNKGTRTIWQATDEEGETIRKITILPHGVRVGKPSPVEAQVPTPAYGWLHQAILDLPLNHEQTIEFSKRDEAARAQAAVSAFARKIKALENGYKIKTSIPQGTNCLIISKVKAS